jgi:hypothetical protein
MSHQLTQRKRVNKVTEDAISIICKKRTSQIDHRFNEGWDALMSKSLIPKQGNHECKLI